MYETDSRLACPTGYETATGTFDAAGTYPENDPADPDCAGCGCKQSEHTRPTCDGCRRRQAVCYHHVADRSSVTLSHLCNDCCAHSGEEGACYSVMDGRDMEDLDDDKIRAIGERPC